VREKVVCVCACAWCRSGSVTAEEILGPCYCLFSDGSDSLLCTGGSCRHRAAAEAEGGICAGKDRHAATAAKVVEGIREAVGDAKVTGTVATGPESIHRSRGDAVGGIDVIGCLLLGL
jgi:hypothetical protein